MLLPRQEKSAPTVGDALTTALRLKPHDPNLWQPLPTPRQKQYANTSEPTPATTLKARMTFKPVLSVAGYRATFLGPRLHAAEVTPLIPALFSRRERQINVTEE